MIFRKWVVVAYLSDAIFDIVEQVSRLLYTGLGGWFNAATNNLNKSTLTPTLKISKAQLLPDDDGDQMVDWVVDRT